MYIYTVPYQSPLLYLQTLPTIYARRGSFTCMYTMYKGHFWSTLREKSIGCFNGGKERAFLTYTKLAALTLHYSTYMYRTYISYLGKEQYSTCSVTSRSNRTEYRISNVRDYLDYVTQTFDSYVSWIMFKKGPNIPTHTRPRTVPLPRTPSWFFPEWSLYPFLKWTKVSSAWRGTSAYQLQRNSRFLFCSPLHHKAMRAFFPTRISLLTSVCWVAMPSKHRAQLVHVQHIREEKDEACFATLLFCQSVKHAVIYRLRLFVLYLPNQTLT